MVCTEKQCFVPDNMLKVIYSIGVGLLFLLIVVNFFIQFTGPGIFVLAFIYALLGGLMVFKKISIVCCPAKVLIVGVAYIFAMAALNKLLF